MDKITIDVKKDLIGWDEIYVDWFTCPNCGDTFVRYNVNYCSNCGCEFNWINLYEKAW